ncbi:MAG: hypothetical protein ACLQQ4_11350 [Bacteroidia bacterium]
MKTNSSRAIEAAAHYIDSLYQQGKNAILLHTFSGEICSGKIAEQDIQYNPLKVTLTLISDSTAEYHTFDLSEVASIQPLG